MEGIRTELSWICIVLMCSMLFQCRVGSQIRDLDIPSTIRIENNLEDINEAINRVADILEQKECRE